jgi:hypothetical protein
MAARMTGRPALLLALLLAVPGAASAEWVRASGSYLFPPVVPEAEACQAAEERARADAVRQVSGETLASEDILRCTEQNDQADCARNSVVWTAVGGDIRGVRERTQQTTADVEGYRKCSVTLEADVKVAEGMPDPAFDLGVGLNNSVFREGEPLVVTLKPSQAMAVQIFQWLPYEKGDAQIARIFPNAFETVERIDKPITVPTEAGGRRYTMKLGFPAGMSAKRKMVDEYLMVVATRKPMAFRDSYSLDDFNRLLSELPRADRRIVRRAYNIVRGGECTCRA